MVVSRLGDRGAEDRGEERRGSPPRSGRDRARSARACSRSAVRRSHRSFTTSRPSTARSPASGRSSVTRMRNSVVFPAPSGPMMPKSSPGAHVERHLVGAPRRRRSAAPAPAPRPPGPSVIDSTGRGAIVSSPGIPIRSRPSGLATRDLHRVHLVGPLVARLDRRGRELRARRDPGDPARHRGDRVGPVHPDLTSLAEPELGELRRCSRRPGR